MTDHRSTTRARRTRMRRALVAMAVTGGLLASCGRSQTPRSSIQFGVYPGGPVGTIGTTTDSPRPENAGRRLAALESLRNDGGTNRRRNLIVRLYEAFTGDPQVDSWTGSGSNAVVDRQIASYAANGFTIDLVIRFEPLQSLGPNSVNMYLQFLRGLVDHYAPDRHVRFLQVANEVNVTTSAQSSDGYYQGAVPALVFGVEAAASEVALHPHDPLEVGFNWAEEPAATGSGPLWQFISEQGLSFRKSVRWVGLDDYPGTFTALGTSPAATGRVLAENALDLRAIMSRAGLPASVPMHISEAGYPTGANRSPAAQVTALKSMIQSIEAVAKRANIQAFEWFDLRDSDSSAPSFQEHYGLLTDHYRGKPSFAMFQKEIAAG